MFYLMLALRAELRKRGAFKKAHSTEDEAKEAIQKFNSGQLDGKTIIVSEARPKKEGGRTRPYPSSPGGGFRGGRGRRD
jgi:hypothetical protein